jgi:hypothetical protein
MLALESARLAIAGELFGERRKGAVS